MNELIEQALLYDFYSELLTTQQRKIYEEIHFNDYSLSEVAKDEHVSRQGIYDMIHRTEKTLCEYEKKLGLVKKYLDIKKLAAKIEADAEKAKNGDMRAFSRITKAAKKIQEF